MHHSKIFRRDIHTDQSMKSEQPNINGLKKIDDENAAEAQHCDLVIVDDMAAEDRQIYGHGIGKVQPPWLETTHHSAYRRGGCTRQPSIPSAFATLGMIAGITCTVGVGLIAIYTSYVIGQVKLAYPCVSNYADAGGLLMGCFGYGLIYIMLLLQLLLVTGSHCLTGTIAPVEITGSNICSIVFAVVSSEFS
ncbi:uncharacterized protein EURHEDRAFT_406415 [Aspergillus ruber CBS 135680]|uniref:Amino acid transporter transmembrane domain-containing protein n=1 Tax=Aspergillus ruber (strain CBS 135680) TaxID=1388766 RepID=A0A017S2A1_ASPRC|nr:uncharacterized protein EURHEDRAFT_406415 [Aspergillus ruber CBS 135680]EYE90961.1 hypothetical protein EURHEDRAFT_406415 [Aspergillus ruber CBS 135680]